MGGAFQLAISLQRCAARVLTHEDYEPAVSDWRKRATTMKFNLTGHVQLLSLFRPRLRWRRSRAASIRRSASLSAGTWIRGTLGRERGQRHGRDGDAGSRARAQNAGLESRSARSPSSSSPARSRAGSALNTFVKNHTAEMPKIDAAWFMTQGPERCSVSRWKTCGRPRALMQEIYSPLQEVFDLRPLSTRISAARIMWRSCARVYRHISVCSFPRAIARRITARPTPSTRSSRTRLTKALRCWPHGRGTCRRCRKPCRITRESAGD